MKNAYIFLADGFEESEALTSVDVLRRVGVNVKIVSVEEGEIVKSSHDVSILCDANFENCDFVDADMAILPGGLPGANTLANNEPLHKLLMRMFLIKKYVAAICAAPMVLGKIGISNGRHVTCYPGFEKYLLGAICTGEMVEHDGNLITGKGPAAALPFALELAKALVGEAKTNELKKAMVCPK